MNDIKVILLCSSRFAFPAMHELLFSGRLCAVAIPEQCDEMLEQTVTLLKNTGVPVLALQKNNFAEKLLHAITQYGIDLGLVMSFSFRIPEQVYATAPCGFFNLHPGPLPSYRGADPVFHQIKNRDNRAAVTLHKLDAQYDTGDIVAMEMIPLHPADTHGILTTRLSVVAARLVGVLLKLILFKAQVPGRKQDEARAMYYKKQTAADITINWQTMDAASIVALINACNPWNKGAVTKIQNTMVRFLLAEPKENNGTKEVLPGTILSFENSHMTVAAFNNSCIEVKLIYIDEGFLPPAQLRFKGILPGMRFEQMNEVQKK